MDKTIASKAAKTGAEPNRSGGFNFNFVENGKYFFILTGIIVLAGIVSFIVRGFNWDIDFVGGTILQYRIHQTVDNSVENDVRDIVEGITGKSVTVLSAGADKNEVVIKSLELDSETRTAIFDAIAEKYGITERDILDSSSVTESVGRDLARTTIIAVIVVIILILIYVTIRFDFFSGAATIAGMVHDLFIMLTFYSILQIPMDLTVIAAFLTVLGYSINATIIVFDRIRENMKLRGSKTDLIKLMNDGINSTLTRSFNTTITTLLTVVTVFILGVSSVRDFTLPLIVGIVSGLYSSICLTGPLWYFFLNLKNKNAKNAKAK